MTKKHVMLIVIAVALLVAVIFFKTGSAGTATLWKIADEGAWLFPLIVVSALIDSVNPCAISILLLTIAFLFSIGKLRGNIVKIGASYILGIFFVYLLIGLGLLQTLHLFDTPHFMAKAGAVLLIALGLINIIGEFFPSFPLKLRIPSASHHTMARLMEKASLPTAFLLGGLVGLCEFPCTGGPYLMALGLLHDQTTYLTGVLYLLLYNVLFVLPLLLILLLGSDSAVLNKLQEWKKRNTKTMRFASGLAMIALAVIAIAFF